VDAVTGTAIGPYWKFRLTLPKRGAAVGLRHAAQILRRRTSLGRGRPRISSP